MTLKNELTHSEPDVAALERVWSGMRAKSARRPKIRVALVGGAALAVAAAAVVFFTLDSSAEVVAGAPSMVTRAFGAKSTATFTSASSFGVSPETSVIALHAGHGHFVVDDQSWVVTSRHLRLDVASATFTLDSTEQLDSVTVERGEVRVRRPSGDVVLRAGQTFTSGAESVDWETLARAGELKEAWKLLQHAGVVQAATGSDAERRMLLSEVAAAGRDGAISESLLREVMAVESPQRGLAAYTLGRRLQADGRTKEAKEAFDQAREFGVPSELQEDLDRR